MRLLLVVLLLVLVRPAHAAEQRCADAEDRKPYDGPLFDAMAQIESTMSGNVTKALDEQGIARMALFARVHPKRSAESSVLWLKRRYGERLVLGTPKAFDQRDDLSDGFVDRTLSFLRDERYRFVGEILFAHADKTHGEQTPDGERYVAPEGRNVQRLLAALEARKTPLMFHWEVYDWERDWPAFDRLFSRFPGVTFIWTHAGHGSAEQVRSVVSSHANVIVTLSKEEKYQRAFSSQEKASTLGGPLIDRCGRVLPEWRELIERYPDRFMFATDAHKDFRWAVYPDIVKRWRDILGQFPEPLARSLASGNAEQIYGVPR
jgi:hypothetical protein